MALVKCPNCKNELSSFAERCPNPTCQFELGAQEAIAEHRIVSDDGNVVFFDNQQLIELIEAADAGGEGEATVVGNYYLQKGELGRATDYLIPVAEKGNTSAIYYLSKFAGIMADQFPEDNEHKQNQLNWLRLVVDAGHSAGKNDLAMLLFKSEPSEALRLATESSEQGHSLADVTLGYFYELGVGTLPDERKSFEYFLRAAENKKTKAYDRVARAYAKGVGVEQDVSKAIEWYVKAANADLLSNFQKLVEMVSQHPEFGDRLDEFVVELEEAACQGDVRAAQMVGKYLFEADDWKRALRYLDIAAENDDAEAIYMLSQCYYAADNPKFAKTSNDLLHRSAELGFAKAQYTAGILSRKSNPQLAFKYMEAAADDGNPEALHMLGIFYISGVGTNQDIEKSFRYTQKAAENGFVGAFAKLGNMYALGMGVDQDVQAASFWFEKAIAEDSDEESLKEIQSDLIGFMGRVELENTAELLTQLTVRLATVQVASDSSRS